MMKNYKIHILLFGLSYAFIQATTPFIFNKNVGQEGIFDIQNEIKVQARVDFDTPKAGGISTFQTKRTSPTTFQTDYTFERNELTNPFHIHYNFEIRQLTNNDFEIDMTGVMPLQSMYIDSSIAVTYKGTHLIYPNYPIVNNELAAAKGTFTLQFQEKQTRLLSYEVAVTDRKIIGKEELSVLEKTYQAYVHTYNFTQKTILDNGKVTSILEETVIEWLVPNYGIIKRERDGKVTIPSIDKATKENSFNLKLQSTLLTVE